MEQTTAVGIRGMRGMSAADKKLVGQSGTAVFGGAAKVPTTPPLNEFSCACATGWTGPTCEISKCKWNFSYAVFSCPFLRLRRKVFRKELPIGERGNGENTERLGTERGK